MPRRKASAIARESEAPAQPRRSMYLKESSILKPLADRIDPDEWPCFLLEDATVYKPDGRRLEKLLHASEDCPLTVRGRLKLDKKDKQYLLKGASKAPLIEIRNVTDFSFGTGAITIWAEGLAGWFEIEPAAAYQSIYEEMCEGIVLYYNIADSYTGAREAKKADFRYKRALNVDALLDGYVNSLEEPISRQEAADRCYQHREFLMTQMCKPNEPVQWMKSSFFRWLCQDKDHRRPAKTDLAPSKLKVEDADDDSKLASADQSASAEEQEEETEEVADKKDDDIDEVMPDATPPRRPSLVLPANTGTGKRPTLRLRPPSHPSSPEMSDPISADGTDNGDASQPADSQYANGIWQCEEEGCTFVVEKAHTAEGEKAVEVHKSDHADDLVMMVQREGENRNLPVGHLLALLRQIGQRREQEAMQRRAVPEPGLA